MAGTVGSRSGGSFVSGQGWRADSDSDGIDYVVPGGCVSCTLEFDVTNFGRVQGAPALKDYKWISMGDGNTFGDFTVFRDHPWKMHLEQRSDGDGTGMKFVWPNGASIEGGNPGDQTPPNDSTHRLAEMDGGGPGSHCAGRRTISPSRLGR